MMQRYRFLNKQNAANTLRREKAKIAFDISQSERTKMDEAVSSMVRVIHLLEGVPSASHIPQDLYLLGMAYYNLGRFLLVENDLPAHALTYFMKAFEFSYRHIENIIDQERKHGDECQLAQCYFMLMQAANRTNQSEDFYRDINQDLVKLGRPYSRLKDTYEFGKSGSDSDDETISVDELSAVTETESDIINSKVENCRHKLFSLQLSSCFSDGAESSDGEDDELSCRKIRNAIGR